MLQRIFNTTGRGRILKKAMSHKNRKKIKDDDSGVAMIFVMIVSAVVLAFCLSMLLVTYTLFTQTSRQTTQMQCKLLVQTFSESLGEELKDPDSEISRYLGNQIRNGLWVSEGTSEETMQSGAFRELKLNMDDSCKPGDYNLSVTLTYSLNVQEDDENETEAGRDDQDEDFGNTGVTNPDPGLGGSTEPPAGNGTYCINASVKCERGEMSERDVQYYVIDMIYPAVALQVN